MKIFREILTFFRETRKKGREKISRKIWPPRFWSSGSASDSWAIIVNVHVWRTFVHSIQYVCVTMEQHLGRLKPRI